MVGFVIVSHSENLAKSVVELTSIMAPSARIAPAGGMDDGGFGTSFEKIQAAIESVYSDDGVLVLVDLGSAGGRSQGSLGRRRAYQRSGSYQRPGQLCGREGTGASGSGSHLLFLYAGSHCGAGIETDTGNRYRIQNPA